MAIRSVKQGAFNSPTMTLRPAFSEQAAAREHVIVKLDPSELANWYASHPAVRRMWAVEDSVNVRVIVSLEPTQDGDDVNPVWFANGHAWSDELRSCMDRTVRLELLDDANLAELRTAGADRIVAEWCWRDPSASDDYPFRRADHD